MGSIDPVPQAADRHQPPPRPEPPKPKPIPVPPPTMGLAGVLGITVGLVFFIAGAFGGWNLLTMGIGVAFIAAGSRATTKRPMKLCPACRFEIPVEAQLCGHCRTDQPA